MFPFGPVKRKIDTSTCKLVSLVCFLKRHFFRLVLVVLLCRYAMPEIKSQDHRSNTWFRSKKFRKRTEVHLDSEGENPHHGVVSHFFWFFFFFAFFSCCVFWAFSSCSLLLCFFFRVFVFYRSSDCRSEDMWSSRRMSHQRPSRRFQSFKQKPLHSEGKLWPVAFSWFR